LRVVALLPGLAVHRGVAGNLIDFHLDFHVNRVRRNQFLGAAVRFDGLLNHCAGLILRRSAGTGAKENEGGNKG
jgi:hypothetical protein